MYRLFFKLILQRIDAESAHGIASRTLKIATAIPFIRAIMRRFLCPSDSRLEVRALGLTFPSPVGVAAGVDKDGSWFESLGLLGFGFVEVGTVTAHPQPGNPRPRVFRLLRDRAVLNKMGFPNPGAAIVADNLGRGTGRTIVGVNVGKSKVASLEHAGDDYCAAVRRLAPLSDYLVINVSSPNTPGLRAMQAVDLLRPLVAAVRDELDTAGVVVPLLIKIGPDLADEELDAVADLATELAIDGIVAVNTTVDRGGLVASYDDLASIRDGGISGAPLKTRAVDVLRRLYRRVGEGVVLISVGGIETPDDVWERILAGATLVQVHTGFIYQGPAWPRRMNRALVRRASRAGQSSIQELVGTGFSGTRDLGRPGSQPAAAPTSETPDAVPVGEAKVATRGPGIA